MSAKLTRISRQDSRASLEMSQAYMDQFADVGDYGMWIAQYANNRVTGYQRHPWNEGAYFCAIRQYSSHGRLAGYEGNLDLDKFYGDRTAWDKYAGKGNTIEPNIYIVKPGDNLSVIAARYGTTYQKIAEDNGIGQPNLIYPGQRLVIKGK